MVSRIFYIEPKEVSPLSAKEALSLLVKYADDKFFRILQCKAEVFMGVNRVVGYCEPEDYSSLTAFLYGELKRRTGERKPLLESDFPVEKLPAKLSARIVRSKKSEKSV